ncbi:sensor histidine kinase [Tepidibacter formicigenes]|jgi:two-component system sensor histidine kinase DegS|uniref:histidine kinase n=1 Tax=Tepidibacter formicigenes DSM 15518 TaxID=1123349 RepID=A0A1M6K5P7_9FIRM|nr:sensor histidine kinase [Tepidibacter formicigenes]SHJ54292.1 two-component system, NarL family, sensor histidine kinase DegS [Tepidibacter formicigenes DSM 15518]
MIDESKYFVDLNGIFNKVVETIKNSQDEVMAIYEGVHSECEKMKIELENLKIRVKLLIDEVDYLEKEEKKTKQRLALISKNFQKYSEEKIRSAYEEAKDIQIKLTLKREEEKNLIISRNELEIRLRKLNEILEKGENYMSKMKSVADFLVGDLENVSKKMTSLEGKAKVGMKIIKSQEEERRRIVRDIHDGPAQSIASLVIKSEIIDRLMNKDISLVKDEIKNMKKVLRSTLKDVRRIMYDLSPSSIDDLGLIPTINRIISDIQYEKDINIDLVVLNNEKITHSLVRLTTFRIIQESLNNACKHSKAKNIRIRLDINKKRVAGVVEDDGIGFDINLNSKLKGSLGIGFMKERASLLDGQLTIDSKIGEGTKVIFAFPNKEVEHEG